MKKNLSRILSAILLLCMIPATFITALAHGPGVAKDETENQYYDNANGQYVPELIKVDGKLADSGWGTSDWQYTTARNSTWDSDFPAEQNLGLTYRYQLKLDETYFYAAAVITMPENVTSGIFNIYLSEQKVNQTDMHNRGTTGGFIFTIDKNAEKVVDVKASVGGDEEAVAEMEQNGEYSVGGYTHSETITDNGGRSVLSIAGADDIYGRYDKIPEYEAYQLACSFENGVVIIEFRNRAVDTYDTEMVTDYDPNTKCSVSYYVSMDVANAKNISGSGYDKLFSPLYSRGTVETLRAKPTAESWPGGGNVVDIDNNDYALPSVVTVDGKFNEALWAGFTDYYQSCTDNLVDHVDNDNKAFADFDSVKYLENVYTKIRPESKWQNLTKGNTYEAVKGDIGKDSNYADTNNKELTDGERLSGTVENTYNNPKWVGGNRRYDETLDIVVPLGNGTALYDLYKVVANVYDNAGVAGIYEPSLDVYYTEDGENYQLFGSYTAKGNNTKTAIDISVVRTTPVKAKAIKFVFIPDTFSAKANLVFISELEAFGVKNDDPEYMAKYDIRTDDEYLFGAVYQYNASDVFPGFYLYANDDTDNDLTIGMESYITESVNGDCKNIEFKIPLAYVDPDGDGNFNYAIKIGSVMSEWVSVTSENCVGDAADAIVLDGEIDDAMWIALRAGDSKFDSVGRDGYVTTPVEHFAYDLKTDGTYIYGAATVEVTGEWRNVVSGKGSGRQGHVIRIWLLPDGVSESYQFYPMDFYITNRSGETAGPMMEIALGSSSPMSNPVFVDYSLNIDTVNGNGRAILEFKLDIAKFNSVMSAYAETNSKGFNGFDSGIAGNDSDTFLGYYVSLDMNDPNVPNPETGKTYTYYTFFHSYEKNSYENLSSLTDDAFEAGANKITYGDFLDRVTVDGKIEEEIWLNNMITVNQTNGTYTYQPYDGYGLEYSYKVYTAGNYLYGAVVMDYVGNKSNKMNFNIWFDNYVDERELMQEYISGTTLKYKSAPVEYQVEQDTTKRTKYDANGDPVEVNGKKQTDTFTNDEIIYYVNQQYTFNLYGEQYTTPRPTTGEQQYLRYDLNPEAAPDYYLKKTGETNGQISMDYVEKKNGTHYAYQYKVINGKTYLEFMVDLESVRCADTDFRFFVDMYYYSAGKNREYDLYHPKIGEYDADGKVTYTEPIWVQNYNFYINNAEIQPSEVASSTARMRDAMGTIITKAKYFSGSNGAVNKNWDFWTHVLLRNISGNTFEVKKIVHQPAGYTPARYFAASDFVDDSYYVYVLNGGSFYNTNAEYTYYNTASGKSEFKQTPEPIDRMNFRAEDIESFIALYWNEGDVITFNFGEGVDFKSIPNNPERRYITYTGRDVDPTNAISDIGIGKTSGTIIQALDATINKNIDFSRAIYCPYTVERTVTSAINERIYSEWNPFMPEFDKYGSKNTWMYGTTLKVISSVHVKPETVTVDGNLNDTAWIDEGWTMIDNDINGSNLNGIGVDFKYQLRIDNEYLYVAAVIESAYDAGTSFRLWLNGNESESFSKYYELGNGKTTLKGIAVPDSSWNNNAENVWTEGYAGSAFENGTIAYDSALIAADNASDNDPDGENSINVLGYDGSMLYGYTYEILESTHDGIWVWTADPQTQGFRFGRDHGVICNADGTKFVSSTQVGNGNQTIVEFKVALDEFDGKNGFEYYVQASCETGTTVYPHYEREVASENNYADYNHPSWKWSQTAKKIGGLDMVPSGKLWLTNDYEPVTSLGAKVNDNYNGGKAIRFGARYTEEFIRLQDVVATESEQTDYWDVADMGIVILPYYLVLQGEELTIDNENARYASAQDIINWRNHAPEGDTNFADYESFVFYVNLTGLPDTEAALNMEFSFCGYIDYYAANGSESFYGIPLVRSYNGVENMIYTESGDGIMPDKSTEN